jgi:hypothetical protein
MIQETSRYYRCVHQRIPIPNYPLVVTPFIEMELLHVQGPKNNIKAVGEYLHADGPFEG